MPGRDGIKARNSSWGAGCGRLHGRTFPGGNFVSARGWGIPDFGFWNLDFGLLRVRSESVAPGQTISVYVRPHPGLLPQEKGNARQSQVATIASTGTDVAEARAGQSLAFHKMLVLPPPWRQVRVSRTWSNQFGVKNPVTSAKVPFPRPARGDARPTGTTLEVW